MTHRYDSSLDSPAFQVPTKHSQLEDRFQAAFLFSAIGDALGWPTEFLKNGSNPKPSFNLPIRDFVSWEKRVGGLWWGYKDKIQAGEYSDDTQLCLALARSISDSGRLQPEQFAYFELPLWLHYERGGGRSIKAAARSIIAPRSTCFRNFYKKPGLDYRSAGANGAAMRTLPIALANLNYEDRTVVDTFLNAIITHGHPNAIIGAVLFALAVQYVLMRQSTDTIEMLGYLKSTLERSWSIFFKDPRVRDWISYWEQDKSHTRKFESLYLESLRTVRSHLDAIPKFLESRVEDYYHQVGALDIRTKGSGIGTVSTALYLFSRDAENSQRAIETAVNVLG